MSEQKALSREALLATTDQLAREWVEHPNGGGVWVREMMGAERDRYERWVLDIKIDAKGNVTQRPVLEQARAKLCVLTMVTDEGGRYFTDDDLGVVDTLGARFIDRVFATAQRLNGLSREDMDDLVGNSESDRPDSSP